MNVSGCAGPNKSGLCYFVDIGSRPADKSEH